MISKSVTLMRLKQVLEASGTVVQHHTTGRGSSSGEKGFAHHNWLGSHRIYRSWYYIYVQMCMMHTHAALSADLIIPHFLNNLMSDISQYFTGQGWGPGLAHL